MPEERYLFRFSWAFAVDTDDIQTYITNVDMQCHTKWLALTVLQANLLF